ncbi:MAG: tetratricopeptide repeat protein [Myxococcota bacterium]
MKLPRQIRTALGWLSAASFLFIFAAGLAQSFERTGQLPPIHTGYNGALDYLSAGEDDPEDMIEQLELALQIVVNEQHIQNHNLSLALHAQGELSRSMQHAQAAVAIRPEYIPARLHLASSLFAAGRVSAGIAQLDQAHQFEPENADVLVQTGLGYGKLRELGQAEHHYRKAIAVDGRHPVAHFNLARVLHVQGKFPEAVQLYRRAAHLAPGYKPRALRYLKQLGVPQL